MAKNKQKIITLLADYPGREFYAQEIAEKTECSKASASNILKSLADKKVIFKEAKGRMKFYRINQGSPEVKRARIDLALEKLVPALAKLKKSSLKIILFGSASRGDQTAGSDIDLFILSKDKNETRKILEKTSRNLQIKAIIKTPSEWSEMEVQEPEFYREIRDGITLYNYVPRI
jgi:predicted nucleotidyltransferase